MVPHRLFAARLDVVRAVDRKAATLGGFGESEQPPLGAKDGLGGPPSEEAIRADATAVLRAVVAGMNLDNFIVRQHRRLVEIHQAPEAWTALDDAKRDELVAEIAPLPSAARLGTEEARRFDLLLFSLELALLKGSKRFDALRNTCARSSPRWRDRPAFRRSPGRRCSSQRSRPMPGGESVTVPLLELVRLRLRDLVQHIEKGRKVVVYSDFPDEIGEGVEHALPRSARPISPVSDRRLGIF